MIIPNASLNMGWLKNVNQFDGIFNYWNNWYVFVTNIGRLRNIGANNGKLL